MMSEVKKERRRDEKGAARRTKRGRCDGVGQYHVERQDSFRVRQKYK